MESFDEDAPINLIRRGLQPLLVGEESIDRAVKGVKAVMDHLPDLSNRSPDSDLFDFRGRVEPVLEHFSHLGLARDDYLKAAVRHPQLFCLSAGNVIGNIEGVIARFGADGLTTEAYLRAATKQPSLFYQRPETIIANVEGIIAHWARDNLTRASYLRMATKQPSLFPRRPETIIANFEGVIDHFAHDGLTRSNYLRIIEKHPSLLCQRPETIIANIEGVIDHFAHDGLTRADYLRAIIKQSSLFLQNPETIIGHINLVEELYSKGLLPITNSTRGPPPQVSPVLAFLVNEPSLLTLAADNFALREIAAHVTQAPPTPTILRRARGEVERELAKTLGHRDLIDPISKVDPAAEAGPYARNLLLRALVREGWVKGRLV